MGDSSEICYLTIICNQKAGRKGWDIMSQPIIANNYLVTRKTNKEQQKKETG